MNLSNWLRKTPQPSAVLADEQRIEVGKNVRAYRDLIETIKAIDPTKVTCLDGSGNTIRSIVLNAPDEEKTPQASAEMSDLQLFAKLLAEGYEHGRKANQPIIDSAMQFVERQSVRLAKAENEIERLRAHNHKLNMQIIELSVVPAVEPAGGDDSIMSSLIAGAMQSSLRQHSEVASIKNGVKK